MLTAAAQRVFAGTSMSKRRSWRGEMSSTGLAARKKSIGLNARAYIEHRSAEGPRVDREERLMLAISQPPPPRPPHHALAPLPRALCFSPTHTRTSVESSTGYGWTEQQQQQQRARCDPRAVCETAAGARGADMITTKLKMNRAIRAPEYAPARGTRDKQG